MAFKSYVNTVLDKQFNEKPLEVAVTLPADNNSHQGCAYDANVPAAVGTSDVGDSAFIAAAMFNLIGDALTKTKNYLAGMIGAYSVTGVKASTYPAGAVLGVISDTVTEADGAVVAVIDGDSGVTKANAAFKAMSNNSTGGSGFDFGMDLHGAAHDGYSDLAILKADIRMAKEVCMLTGAAAPVDGVSGSGAGFAGPGSMYVDRGGFDIYINAGTKASPVWKKVTRAA